MFGRHHEGCQKITKPTWFFGVAWTGAGLIGSKREDDVFGPLLAPGCLSFDSYVETPSPYLSFCPSDLASTAGLKLATFGFKYLISFLQVLNYLYDSSLPLLFESLHFPVTCWPPSPLTSGMCHSHLIGFPERLFTLLCHTNLLSGAETDIPPPSTPHYAFLVVPAVTPAGFCGGPHSPQREEDWRAMHVLHVGWGQGAAQTLVNSWHSIALLLTPRHSQCSYCPNDTCGSTPNGRNGDCPGPGVGEVEGLPYCTWRKVMWCILHSVQWGVLTSWFHPNSSAQCVGPSGKSTDTT